VLRKAKLAFCEVLAALELHSLDHILITDHFPAAIGLSIDDDTVGQPAITKQVIPARSFRIIVLVPSEPVEQSHLNP
jgi:hypothetical protein